MKNTLIRITAQVWENYGSEETPYWKAKGGQEFNLMADSDDFFYGEEMCLKAIDKILLTRSNSHYRYERLDHEIIFGEPRTIFTYEFYETLKAMSEPVEQ